MTVQTAARPTNIRRAARINKPLHVAVPSRTRPRSTHSSATPCVISPAKLEEVENRLLAEAIEHHAHLDAALDGALEDMAVLSAELARSRRRPLLLRSTTSLNRVEDLMLEAIVRAHPNRENALDRLLADVTGDDGSLAVTVAAREEYARAEFDMTVDNDFDGLG